MCDSGTSGFGVKEGPTLLPVEGFPTAPSSYPEPPVSVLSYVDPDASARSSPIRVAADGPEMDVFQSYLSTSHRPARL